MRLRKDLEQPTFKHKLPDSLRDSIDTGHSFSVLIFLLSNSLLSLQNSFSVLVKLELGDHDVGRVEWDLGLLAYMEY